MQKAAITACMECDAESCNYQMRGDAESCNYRMECDAESCNCRMECDADIGNYQMKYNTGSSVSTEFNLVFTLCSDNYCKPVFL